MDYINNIKLSEFISSVYLLLLAIAVVILLSEKAVLIFPPVLSFAAFFVVDGVLLLLSDHWIFSAVLTGTLLIILKFFNQLKLHYYKEYLTFSDFNVMADVTNFSMLFRYKEAGLAVIGFIIFLLVNTLVSWPAGTQMHLAGRSVGGIMAVIGMIVVYMIAQRFRSRWLEIVPGDPGTLANVIMSATIGKFESPKYAASADNFRAMMDTVKLPVSVRENKPDIILLLQESTFNPCYYSLPEEVKLPPLFMFQRDEQVSAQGLMRVQTYGGGTWRSEFSALSGLNSDDFGNYKNSVFYFVVDHLNYSLFKALKAQGYYTVALTSFNPSTYHSGHAYTMMGVDRILQPQDLGYAAAKRKNLWTITTVEMLNYVKKIVEQETDKPIFVFSLTIYEHGPYNVNHRDDYQLSGKIKNSSVGMFSHYMEKLIHSDAAIADFAKFVSERDKPTMFLYFGDHQPAIGLDDYQITIDDPKCATQFTLRDNLSKDNKIPEMALMDISFLGGLILERAQLPVNEFWRANIAMRYLSGGKLDDCEDKQLLTSYKHYLYQYLNAAGRLAEK